MRRLAPIVLWLAAAPAFADHPGDRLDDVMAGKEPAFEATDVPDLPDLDLVTADEEILRLNHLAGQIIVLSFVPEGCAEPCAAQQAKLEKVREDIEVTPMRDMVTFLAVRPQQSIGAAEGDAANWREAAPRSGTSVAELSKAFARLSDRDERAPMIHVIDRAGRHAAIFHGAGFEPLNMVLYINGLTNAPPPPEPGLLDRLMGLLW